MLPASSWSFPRAAASSCGIATSSEAPSLHGMRQLSSATNLWPSRSFHTAWNIKSDVSSSSAVSICAHEQFCWMRFQNLTECSLDSFALKNACDTWLCPTLHQHCDVEASKADVYKREAAPTKKRKWRWSLHQVFNLELSFQSVKHLIKHLTYLEALCDVYQSTQTMCYRSLQQSEYPSWKL